MAEALIRKADRPGDLGWVLMAHGEIYAAEYGWGPSFETLVAQIVADYAADHDPELEAGWIAELDGERVGCIVAARKIYLARGFKLIADEPQGLFGTDLLSQTYELDLMSRG